MRAGAAHNVLNIIRAQVAVSFGKRLAHPQGRAAGDDIGPGRHHSIGIGGLRAGRGHSVAHAFQKLRRILHGGPAVRMDRIPGERGLADRNSERLAGGVCRGRKARVQRWRPVGGPEIGALADVEQKGRVAHAARQEAFDRHAGPALAGERPVRQARAGRLEAEQAAGGRRDAHGSAAVRAMGRRHDPGGNRGTRPARRSAGGSLKIPGIARRSAVNSCLCRASDAPFRGGGPSEGVHAGGKEPVDQRRVLRIARIAQQIGAIVGGEIDGFRTQVLQ